MKYRPEIDGLRAIAVVPVILYHAGFEYFKGGFIGVDVFFVISGYLITLIIITEIKSGDFRLVNFYERRARRILPALFLVMAASLPFAWFWLLPSDLKAYSKSLLFVSTFSSNIFFWYETGYFNALSELKPFLHTWSLSVEEQYYLIFPTFIIFVWGMGKKKVFFLISIITIFSFLLSEIGTTTKPSVAFYWIPTRIWEIMIGALCALHLSDKIKSMIVKY